MRTQQPRILHYLDEERSKAAEVVPAPQFHGPIDVTRLTFEQVNAIANQGFITDGGLHVRCSTAFPVNPRQGSDVTMYNDIVSKLYKFRGFNTGGDYVKVRIQSGVGPLYDEGPIPYRDIMSIGKAPDSQPTPFYKNAGKITVTGLPPIPERRAESLKKWHPLFSEYGYIATRHPKGLGLKHVESLLPNLRREWGAQANGGNTTLAVSELLAAADITNSMNARPGYELKNQVRPKIHSKTLAEEDLTGTLESISNNLRVEVPRPADRPDYAQLEGFVDRNGRPLWDPKIEAFRRIDTFSEYGEKVRDAHRKLEWLSNGLENHFGEGRAFIIEIIEPPSTKTDSLVDPEPTDPLTPEEAKHNIFSAFQRRCNRFPNHIVGEIKYDVAKLPLFGSERAFEIHVIAFDYQNDDESTWGQIPPNELGFVPRRIDDTDSSSPFLENQSIMDFLGELGRAPRAEQTSARDVTDRMITEHAEKPLMKNEYGDSKAQIYGIYPFGNSEDLLFRHFGEWMFRNVNWSIKYNQGRERGEMPATDKEAADPKNPRFKPGFGPRYKITKLDWQSVLFGAFLYGYDAGTKDPAMRDRLQVPMQIKDLDIANGKRGIEETVIKIPMGWFFDPEMRDEIPFWGGNRPMEFVLRENGKWYTEYVPPQLKHFLARYDEASPATEGILDEETGIWIFTRPRVYDADRRLLHMAELYLRAMDEINDQTEFRNKGWKEIDRIYFQGWTKPMHNVKGEILDIATDCFESGVMWILAPDTKLREKRAQLESPVEDSMSEAILELPVRPQLTTQEIALLELAPNLQVDEIQSFAESLGLEVPATGINRSLVFKLYGSFAKLETKGDLDRGLWERGMERILELTKLPLEYQ